MQSQVTLTFNTPTNIVRRNEMPNKPIQTQDGVSRGIKGQFAKKAIDVSSFKPLRSLFLYNKALAESARASGRVESPTIQGDGDNCGELFHLNEDIIIEEASSVSSDVEDQEEEVVAAAPEAPGVTVAKMKTVKPFKTRELYGKNSKQEKAIKEDPLMINFIESKSSMVVFRGEKVKTLEPKYRMT